MELNPNHPMTSGMREHWHKLCAILVNRTPHKETVISLDEIMRMDGLAITMKEEGNGIVLRIITMEEGENLAKKEGGLPK